MDKELLNAVEKTIVYMKNHLDKEITSEDLALMSGYSTYHFLRVFKEVTGVSPRHFLSALRIEESKQVLIKSSDSVLYALLRVGFRSIGTFSSKSKDLDKDMEYLKSNHVPILFDEPKPCPPGKYVIIKDPTGNQIELVEFLNEI
ncbi:helix-turn-helix domain-containing protein [Bacillus sp. NPDC094106]|uniref:helix-turn-helix domain-containing protein n=1 Tax=Bacillus sp. NPDC094106 TaxID=3363949 RepID=UPI00380606C6